MDNKMIDIPAYASFSEYQLMELRLYYAVCQGNTDAINDIIDSYDIHRIPCGEINEAQESSLIAEIQ
jgi:hypothetical protein